MRDDRQRLLDILEAIENIERYVNAEGEPRIIADDELIQVWVVHHLQIDGYFETNTNIVWKAVERDLPVLKPQIEAMLEELSQGG